MNILNHVNIAEMVTITATRAPNSAKFEVSIVPLSAHQRLVFDEKALATLNEKLTEKAAQFEARDPRAKKYIEEFVARMLPEFQRVGLLEIENIPESEDPYKEIKEKYR
jgi:hypothetical protein